MMKRYGLAVILLFLVLTITGCSAYDGENNNPYMVVDGTATPCKLPATTPNSDSSQYPGRCSYNYYEVKDGKTYACSGWGGCDEDNPVTPPAVTVASPSAGCKPHWTYDQLVDKGVAWKILSSPQESVNNTTSPEQANFSVTIARTVTVTDEKQFTASLGASAKLAIVTITASVKQQVNHSVSQSLTVTVSNSVTLSVPPKETAYGNYGVSAQITSGHLYDTAKCEGSQSDVGTDVTYVPIAVGWCTWFSNQPDPCPSIST
ncbi:MAG TPA: hypothetical protein VKR06_06715 [Ktedonosporobacter sp.]|nr:hypothetical protein [Ktedonosporobacter sp.]